MVLGDARGRDYHGFPLARARTWRNLRDDALPRGAWLSSARPSALRCRGETPEIAIGDFSDNLVVRIMRRYPPQKDLEDEETPRESCALEDMEGGAGRTLEAFVVKQLKAAVESPYFLLVQEVALSNTDTALEKLMKLLESNIRVRGILYRHGLDPDRDYPAVWGKIWESIPKWDGRDFRAYVARIIRNACLDEIARKKRAPNSIDDSDPRDGRPPVQTAAVAAARDALSFLMAVLDEHGSQRQDQGLGRRHLRVDQQGAPGRGHRGRLPPLWRSRPLRRRDRGPRRPNRRRAGARSSSSSSMALQPDEVCALDRDPRQGQVRKIARALGRFEDDEERLIAGELAREGLSVKDLERAQRLTTNAINLCINRIRLKVWMAICDRAYDTLRRRGDVDELELAVRRQPLPARAQLWLPDVQGQHLQAGDRPRRHRPQGRPRHGRRDPRTTDGGLSASRSSKRAWA